MSPVVRRLILAAVGLIGCSTPSAGSAAPAASNPALYGPPQGNSSQSIARVRPMNVKTDE